MKGRIMRRYGVVRLVAVVAGCSFLLAVPEVVSKPSPVPEEFLVGIQLADGIACGALAKMDGNVYIVTSTSAISGQSRMTFKTFSGRPLKPLKIELSLNRDLARFLIDSTNAFEVVSSMDVGESMMMLEIKRGFRSVETVFGTVSHMDEGFLTIEAPLDQLLDGLPAFNSDDMLYGAGATERSYTFKRGVLWVEEVKQKVYQLEGAQWFSPNWKKYNAQYGDLLREADRFRDDLYMLTKKWVDGPERKIELSPTMSLDIRRWIKKQNGVVNRARLARVQHGDTVRGDPYRVVRQGYEDCGYGLIELARKKADTLNFFANDRGATPFIKQQCSGLSFELQLYTAYIKEHLKKSKYLW